jgi:hypothetical protein
MAVGDLGGGAHQGRQAFETILRDDVGGHQGRKGCLERVSDTAVYECTVIKLMDRATKTIEVEIKDLDQIYEFLLDADVVEGSPEFREIVAELWPELLHKVKPPRSEMH